MIAETSGSYRHNIYDYDGPLWDAFELALKVFLQKAPKEFNIIFNEIKKGNASYAMAERVILDEVDILEEKVNMYQEDVKSLKKMLIK